MEENNCKFICSVGFRKSFAIKYNRDYDYKNGYNFENVQENNTIYIKSDYLYEFSKIIDIIPNKFILLSGCSDYTIPNDVFNEEEFLKFINNDKIIHWYVQNLVYNHKKITNLPIGLDYHTIYNHNNHEWGPQMYPIIQENELLQIKNESKHFSERIPKCYANFHFSINTKYGYDRKDALEKIDKNLVFYENNKLKRIDNWKTQSQYSFVISPHGNGLDCHRTWEAIILGCIPIVKTSCIDSLYNDLPVLILFDWNDVNEELLLNTIQLFKEKDFNYNKLTLDYWINLINT